MNNYVHGDMVSDKYLFGLALTVYYGQISGKSTDC